MISPRCPRFYIENQRISTLAQKPDDEDEQKRRSDTIFESEIDLSDRDTPGKKKKKTSAASPHSTPTDANATLPSLPRRALSQASPASSAGVASRCRVLALPCVSSVYVQAGAGPCLGPAAFGRDNTCCPIVRDFVEAGCACDGAFLAVASFGGWNGAKLAQAVRAILSTPCGKGLRDPSCGTACPMATSASASGKSKGGGDGGKEKEKEGGGSSSGDISSKTSPAQPAGSRRKKRRR